MQASAQQPLEGARRVLLIEDDEDDHFLTREYFADFESSAEYQLDWEQTYSAGLAALLKGHFDACLLDYRLGAEDGIELLAEAQEQGCRTPIILLTGEKSREVDREAMRRGAADYLVKSEMSAPLLERSVRHAIERAHHYENQRFLAAASEHLTSSLDPREILDNIAETATEEFADYCAIEMLEGDGAEWIAVGHRCGENQDLGSWLEMRPVLTPLLCPAGEQMSGRESVHIARIDDGAFDQVGFSDELSHALEQLEPVSLIAVPLVARDRLLGAMLLLSCESGNHFDEDDLTLVEQLALRTALATDNARLYEKSQRAIQMRDEVYRIVVHDLRNPLTTINMVTDLVRRRLSSGGDLESLASHVESQKRAAERMNALINDLLDVARLESGKLEIQTAPRSPGELVEETLQHHQLQAEEGAVKLEASVEQDVPTAQADARRVQQVLTNLLGNALRYTPEGGVIEISAQEDGGNVRFGVSDSGPGIPQEHLTRLFDSFWQAKQHDQEGAGLGLAICKGLVEAHGGKIWAESVVDEGTTFYFTIPAVDTE